MLPSMVLLFQFWGAPSVHEWPECCSLGTCHTDQYIWPISIYLHYWLIILEQLYAARSGKLTFSLMGLTKKAFRFLFFCLVALTHHRTAVAYCQLLCRVSHSFPGNLSRILEVCPTSGLATSWWYSLYLLRAVLACSQFSMQKKSWWCTVSPKLAVWFLLTSLLKTFYLRICKLPAVACLQKSAAASQMSATNSCNTLLSL